MAFGREEMFAAKVGLVLLLGALIPVSRAYKCDVVTREDTTNYGKLLTAD